MNIDHWLEKRPFDLYCAYIVFDNAIIATMILSELVDEMQWEQSFAKSHDLLANLAAEVMAGYKAGYLNN